jgi:hypothetical protein
MPRISLEDSLLFQYGVLWNFKIEHKSDYSLTLCTFNVIFWFFLSIFCSLVRTQGVWRYLRCSRTRESLDIVMELLKLQGYPKHFVSCDVGTGTCYKTLLPPSLCCWSKIILGMQSQVSQVLATSAFDSLHP